jgi:hypothetical protein
MCEKLDYDKKEIDNLIGSSNMKIIKLGENN